MAVKKREFGCAVVSLLLLLSGCGGDSATEAEPTTEADTTAEAESSDAATDTGTEAGDDAAQPGSDEGEGEPDAAAGGSALLAIEGTSFPFTVDDITYSPVDGVDDMTFETCDPSFFGAAFRVIGYPVDSAGDLVLDGEDIAGLVQFVIPLTAEDEELTGPPEFDLDYSIEGFDHSLDPLGAGAESSWTIDGNSISGTVILSNFSDETVNVDFEVTCN